MMHIVIQVQNTCTFFLGCLYFVKVRFSMGLVDGSFKGGSSFKDNLTEKLKVGFIKNLQLFCKNDCLCINCENFFVSTIDILHLTTFSPPGANPIKEILS